MWRASERTCRQIRTHQPNNNVIYSKNRLVTKNRDDTCILACRGKTKMGGLSKQASQIASATNCKCARRINVGRCSCCHIYIIMFLFITLPHLHFTAKDRNVVKKSFLLSYGFLAR